MTNYSNKCAAGGNQLHICQFLLEEATWPDHSTVLNYSLGRCAHAFSFNWPRWQEGQTVKAYYQLFLEALEFDLDIEALEEEPSPAWLNRCKDPRILDLILQKIPREILSGSIEARFELAMKRTDFPTTSEFLKCLGMQASDPRLAHLRTKHSGRSVLHYVASRLRDSYFSEKATNDWAGLGVAVMKNGANPSSIAKVAQSAWSHQEAANHEFRWYLTPLLESANVSNWGLGTGKELALRENLKTIQIWPGMVQQAGIDLCKYGANEREAWKTLPKEDPSCQLHQWTVSELVCGPTPEQWSFKVRDPHTANRWIWELGKLPGCFPEDQDALPTRIIWAPSPDEESEGPWVRKEPLLIPSQSVDLRDVISGLEHRDASIEPFEIVQDDTGAVSIMQYRASREKTQRRRSHSQPPPIGLRSTTTRYDLVRYGHNIKKPWLYGFHKSLVDFKWCLCCRFDKSQDMRRCVESASGPSAFQGSVYWLLRSYLAEISDCQDGEPRNRAGLRHTGTADCPWNCKAVNLEGMNVPKALRFHHPRRRSARYEKYRVR